MLAYLLYLSVLTCSIGQSFPFGRQRNEETAKGGATMPDKFDTINLDATERNGLPFGLSIGTTRNAFDVVADDSVVETYDKNADNITLAHANSDVVGFFLSRRPRSARIMAQRPLVYADKKGVNAKLSQWHGKALKEVPLSDNAQDTLEFSVKSICRSTKTTAKITVSIRIFQDSEEQNDQSPTAEEPGSEADKQSRRNKKRLGENAKDIVFSFLRICEVATTGTEQSEALLGLSVSLESAQGESKEVVKNGLPTSLFSVKNTNTNDKSIYNVEGTTKAVFSVRAPFGLVLDKHAIVHDLSVASVDIFGELDFSKQQSAQQLPSSESTSGGQQQQQQQQEDQKGRQTRVMSIGFTCKKAGESLITVFLTPVNTWTPTSFVFRKTCAGTTTGKTIGVREQGLNIYTDRGEAVVRNGLVQSIFKPAMHRSADSEVKRTVIPSEQEEMLFLVQIPAFPKTLLRYPWVSATPFTGQHPIVRPKIKMDRKSWNSLSETLNASFRVTFGCFDEGMSNVVVTILVEEQGEIEFVLRKQCAAPQKDATDLDPVTEINGLNIGLTSRGQEVAENGKLTNKFHWQRNFSDLHVVAASSPFITFYLSKNPGMSLQFMYGPPQISAGEEIAEVEISGSGAKGGYIDNMHAQSTISVSFHCLVEGTSMYNLILPLEEYQDPNDPNGYDYDYLFGGRRLLEEGDSGSSSGNNSSSSSNSGGSSNDYEEKALYITFQKTCSLDPKINPRNGLGGIYEPGLMICLTKDCTPADSSVVVKNGFPTAKFYGQRSLPEEQRYWDIVDNTTLSTRLFVKLSPDANRDEKLSTRSLDLGSPLVVRDNRICAPELSGTLHSSSDRKSNSSTIIQLHKGEKIEEVDVTYNCQFEGLCVLSVIFPVLPRGSISITLAKQCSGATEPAGARVSGLNIGTTPGGHDVVEDGLTLPKFNRFSPKAEETFVTEQAETRFYISYSGEKPLRALEPVVFAHVYSLLSVYLNHELHTQSAQTEEEDDMIVIENNSDEHSNSNNNISSSSSGSSNSSGKEQVLSVDYLCFSTITSAITLTIPILPEGNVQFTWMKACREEGEDYGYDGGSGGDPYDLNLDEYGFNRDFDAGVYEGSGYINIGTTAGGNDVVDEGRTTARYTKQSGELDGGQRQMKTIINKQTAKAAFYLSVPEGSVEFGLPQHLELNNAHGTVVCRPTLTGEAARGGKLEPGKSALLMVEFNCIEGATGVTPVLITIPLSGGNPVVFRVLKICGVYEVTTDMAWTPALVLWVVLGVVVCAAAMCGILWFKCRNRSIKYTKVGARAYMPSEVPLDTFDDELSD